VRGQRFGRFHVCRVLDAIGIDRQVVVAPVADRLFEVTGKKRVAQLAAGGLRCVRTQSALARVAALRRTSRPDLHERDYSVGPRASLDDGVPPSPSLAGRYQQCRRRSRSQARDGQGNALTGTSE
jgi:hypothetical protein